MKSRIPVRVHPGIHRKLSYGSSKLADNKPPFLKPLYDDGYFPTRLIDRCVKFLLDLGEQIETEETANLDGLYRLSYLTILRFNNLIQDQFAEAGNKIAAAAGEAICSEFKFVATAYGFPAADVEYMTAGREW